MLHFWAIAALKNRKNSTVAIWSQKIAHRGTVPVEKTQSAEGQMPQMPANGCRPGRSQGHDRQIGGWIPESGIGFAVPGGRPRYWMADSQTTPWSQSPCTDTAAARATAGIVAATHRQDSANRTH